MKKHLEQGYLVFYNSHERTGLIRTRLGGLVVINGGPKRQAIDGDLVQFERDQESYDLVKEFYVAE